MEPLSNFELAAEKVMADTKLCLKKIRDISSLPIDTVEGGIELLNALRSDIYEDLNQIQHEYLVLRAAQWLVKQKICSDQTQWRWNPRQTGTIDEPDLEGAELGVVTVSAEITTSRRPIGTIDGRMQSTLSKLSSAPGRKFYFVTTEQMQQRAVTKIGKGSWQIEVVLLPVEKSVISDQS